MPFKFTAIKKINLKERHKNALSCNYLLISQHKFNNGLFFTIKLHFKAISYKLQKKK